MFNNDEKTKKNTLTLMRNIAMEQCRFNEDAAIRQAADWIRNDRRFDGVNPDTLAREVFSATRSGRSIKLDGPAYQPRSGSVSV